MVAHVDDTYAVNSEFTVKDNRTDSFLRPFLKEGVKNPKNFQNIKDNRARDYIPSHGFCDSYSLVSISSGYLTSMKEV